MHVELRGRMRGCPTDNFLILVCYPCGHVYFFPYSRLGYLSGSREDVPISRIAFDMVVNLNRMASQASRF